MRNFLSDGDLLTVFVVCSQVQMQELMKCIQRKSMLLWIKASGKSIHVFSTNQLCPVITSIEIYVRTCRTKLKECLCRPSPATLPIDILLSNSIAKSRPPHLRKCLRNSEGRRSNDPLSLWVTSPSFKLFCLFPISHWKTRHHLHLCF